MYILGEMEYCSKLQLKADEGDANEVIIISTFKSVSEQLPGYSVA